MHLTDTEGPGTRHDPLAGLMLDGRFSYPVYHHGRHGTLAELIGTDHALISIGLDVRFAFDAADRDFLDRLPLRFVRIEPPDSDGADGYCDLDFAYTALLAGCRRQAVLVLPDGRMAGSVQIPAQLPALIDGLRREPGHG